MNMITLRSFDNYFYANITLTKLEDAGRGEKVATFRRNLRGREPIPGQRRAPLEDGKKCSVNA